MQKEIFIEENSKTIWPMGMVSILISMEVGIKENSEMTFRRATEKRNGLTEQNMLVLTKME